MTVRRRRFFITVLAVVEFIVLVFVSTWLLMLLDLPSGTPVVHLLGGACGFLTFVSWMLAMSRWAP